MTVPQYSCLCKTFRLEFKEHPSGTCVVSGAAAASPSAAAFEIQVHPYLQQSPAPDGILALEIR